MPIRRRKSETSREMAHGEILKVCNGWSAAKDTNVSMVQRLSRKGVGPSGSEMGSIFYIKDDMNII